MKYAFCNCDTNDCEMIGVYSVDRGLRSCTFFGECSFQVAAQEAILPIELGCPCVGCRIASVTNCRVCVDAKRQAGA